MAKKTILYVNSDKRGDWVRVSSGSTLYELIENKAPSEEIQKCYAEAEREFRKTYPAEFIEKYYSEVPK